MMLDPNGSLYEAEIVRFEGEIGFALPMDYRAFLGATNGGGVRGRAVVAADGVGEVMIDCLFGIGIHPALDLRTWVSEFRGELPPDSLVVGADPGAGFFLLCTDDEQAGVYYYDHAYTHPDSDDESNTYWVADSFATLLSSFGTSPPLPCAAS